VGGTFKSRSEEIKKVGWVDTLILGERIDKNKKKYI